MNHLHKDLHSVLSDRLDVVSLLRLSTCCPFHLQLGDSYWRNRLASLPHVYVEDSWQPTDWKRLFYDVTVIQDYFELTRCISLFDDFLMREFAVYSLSQIVTRPCHGYFGLWGKIEQFLQGYTPVACHNPDHDGCLCGFHSYLVDNKARIQELCREFRDKYEFGVVHFETCWIELDRKRYNTNLFYKLISTHWLHSLSFKSISFTHLENDKIGFAII